MKDILHHWKTNKFIVPDTGDPADSLIVVLTDLTYWVKNLDELMDWCDANDSTLQGMTVEFKDERSLTAFTLRWI